MVFDTASDLIVQPYNRGIQLIKPKDKNLNQFPSIGSLFAMPLLVYFVDFEGVFVDANHHTCLSNIPDNHGYYSDKDLKKAPLKALFKKESAEKFYAQNNNLLDTKALTIYETQSTRLDEVSFSCISFKFPVFNQENTIMGIFGMSAFIDGSAFKEAENLSDSMQHIIQTGLIPHSKNMLPGFHIDGIYLSKQEITCLRLLVAGKTMNQIGLKMGLSQRTVEFYLDNIKQKLHVKTKSDLIEKVIESIWPELLLS
jgi:DNA-binding CsgD family transcriptional regulator